MQNTTQKTEKTFTLTAYEISVLIRAVLCTFKENSPKVLDKIRDTAPWRSVLDIVETAQIETIRDAQNSGEFEKLIEGYIEQLNTIKN